jgi:hypothetical protein
MRTTINENHFKSFFFHKQRFEKSNKIPRENDLLPNRDFSFTASRSFCSQFCFFQKIQIRKKKKQNCFVLLILPYYKLETFCVKTWSLVEPMSETLILLFFCNSNVKDTLDDDETARPSLSTPCEEIHVKKDK